MSTEAGELQLTFTPTMSEQPLDLSADGGVLGLRQWISAGKHEGACSFGDPITFQQELIVVRTARHVQVLVRLPPIHTRGYIGVHRIDAAWSPDGKHLAYTSIHGMLVLRFLSDGSQRIVADHVEAVDW